MRKASRHPTLSSMANSGCLLLSGSGMLPHSLQCPPAFLYLPEVRLRPELLCWRFYLPSFLPSFLTLSLSLSLSPRSSARSSGTWWHIGFVLSPWVLPPVQPLDPAFCWGKGKGAIEVKRRIASFLLLSHFFASSCLPLLDSLTPPPTHPPYFEWNKAVT